MRSPTKGTKDTKDTKRSIAFRCLPIRPVLRVLRVLRGFLFLVAVVPAHAQTETITAILVHGNHTTPDSDILSIAALEIGAPATVERLAAAEGALRESDRFTGVEVRRRYRSIDDPSDILVVIVVDERPTVSDEHLIPGPLARLRGASMWMPILGYADGYGFTYGARVSVLEPLGPRSRLSAPLTWGGERRAGVELERDLVRASASISRRVNPHFDVPDMKKTVALDVERPLVPWLRAGATGRVSRVTFGNSGIGSVNEDAWHQSVGAHLTVDTRRDPSFPRNAVHTVLGVERVGFQAGHAARTTLDARGYLGLVGASVLAVRATASRASAPLPPSEQLLVGGASSLRGYRVGHRAGDGQALLSIEARIPLTSPLSIGRFGVKAFVDAGTPWPAGQRLVDQRFERGIGSGIYFGATALRAEVDVAWPQHGHPRVHATIGVAF
jgi:outer membrane protein assembly factor BamA